jgi:ribosomal-protein-alanine N-acetyltransferase
VDRLTIRSLERADGVAVERILRQSPQAAQWPVESYWGLAAWVAESAGRVFGFVAARMAADELEILNLAVDPAERGKGIGSELLEQAIAFARRSGARRAFLEVRESNLTARRFYERRDFITVGRRPQYYQGPPEDALIMACDIEVAL